MPTQPDKILIVDDDADVRDLLREQVLSDTKRFEVFEAQDGPEGLQMVKSRNPDMIILDLVMPGLSGADFLVALNSQGFSGPVIVETKRGQESSAIDCFRLGATDYLTKPLREAEALRVIEHGLEEVRLRHERRDLLERLQQTNQQLEARLNALTTLASVGKTVSSTFDLQQLFQTVLDAAVSVIGADHATLMLMDDESNHLMLRAGKNMTLVMQERLGEAVNDDIAGLVMTSGEVLRAAGEGIKRFRSVADLNAVIYAPLTAQGKAIGVLTAGNHRKRREFDDNQAQLLEILAGYTTIGIVNARLFTALERRARSMEKAYEELRSASRAEIQHAANTLVGLRQPLLELKNDVYKLVAGNVPPALAVQLNSLGQRVNSLVESVEEVSRRASVR